MSRGRRYNSEPKLNYKKVFAVIIAILVLIMFIFMIKNLLSKGKDNGKISSTSYFAYYEANKWGIIDSAGKVIIEPSYQEMLIVPNEKKDIFLCTYDINEETGEYHTKALNSKNEEINTEFDQIVPLENYDKNQSIWYEQELLKVEKDGKYGLIDIYGKTVLKTEYDKIETIKGIQNSILIQKEGNYGLVNSKGEVVLDTQYKEIKSFGGDYKNGYIVANKEGKYGIVDYAKTTILPNEYEAIENIYGKDLFVIKENGKEKVVNTDGIVVLEKGFDEIKAILQNSGSGVIYMKDKKYGVMNAEGKVILEAKYDELKEAAANVYIAKQNGKYGVISQDGQVKVEYKYAQISYYQQADFYVAENEEYQSFILNSNFEVKIEGILSEVNEEKGYLKIRKEEENKYYNFRFEERSAQDVLTANTLFLSKKEGKYGIVDKKGNVVVDYQYDDAMEQNAAGYLAVKKDGKWGSIDPKGQVAIEPTYSLDEYILIDFIGKWHLGKDVNMNYYCAE